MSDRKRQFLERLEATGEAGVRESLTLKRYGGDHIGWAALWLTEIDQRRSAEPHARKAASQAEQVTIARSAKDAAWAAAIAAREAATEAKRANVIATLALIAAIPAIAISIIAIFVRP